MAYTSKTEMINAIGGTPLLQLMDDPLVGDWTTADADGVTNTDRLNHCITQAGRTINGYAQNNFEVPFDAPTPPMIAELALSLALYYAFRRRRSEFGMPEDTMAEYKFTMKQLERLNEGKLDPGVQPMPSAGNKTVTQYEGPEQLFTEDGLKDFS